MSAVLPPDPTVNTTLLCLAGLLNHHGRELEPARLARDYGLDGRELDDSFVTRIAGDHGFEAAVVRASWRKLCRLGEALPALARLKNGHTVALLAIVHEAGVAKAVVHDPLAEGSSQLRVPRRAFLRAYSGKITLLRPVRDAPTAEKTFGIGWFIPEILKQSSIMRDVAIAAIVLQFLSLASPIFFQLVVDKVLVHESPTTLTVLLIGVGLALVLDGLFRYLRQYLLLFATNRIDIRLARKTFEKLMSLGLTFFEKNTAGVLTQHMQQTERIRQFLTGRLFGTVLDGFGLLIFLPLMWFYSPKLTLVTLGFGALIALAILVLIGPFRRRLEALYMADGARQSLLVESVHGIQTVKSLALETNRQREWERRAAATVRMQFGVGRISAVADAIVQSLQTAMTVAIVAVGALDVFAHQLTLGALIAIQIMAGRVVQPLVQIVSLLKAYQETAMSVRMLGSIMNAPTESLGAVGGLRTHLEGRIGFERVTFRYAGRPSPALVEFDLEIQPGTLVGIMGRSGSGKTTLTRLIQGLYGAEEGVIRIDGNDLRELDLVHLRRQIGVVLQENFLFKGTIRDNLAVTRPDASMREVVRAAELAGAAEFITRLPRGFDTAIEESGTNLSGGQRQRLAIARALLAEPRILIFDEATSALDPESELIVQENLARIARGRTVLIVSHRLSSIAGADVIVVMDKGRLVATGKHRELLGSCPLYHQLWFQQNRFAA
jgi:subfamily B ATP-binding cassette protein HlyB/CyaB